MVRKKGTSEAKSYRPILWEPRLRDVCKRYCHRSKGMDTYPGHATTEHGSMAFDGRERGAGGEGVSSQGQIGSRQWLVPHVVERTRMIMDANLFSTQDAMGARHASPGQWTATSWAVVGSYGTKAGFIFGGTPCVGTRRPVAAGNRRPALRADP